MVQKVETYRTADGRLFESEEAAILHEIELRIATEIPDLKVSVQTIVKNAALLAEIMAPARAETTRHFRIIPPLKLEDHQPKARGAG